MTEFFGSWNQDADDADMEMVMEETITTTTTTTKKRGPSVSSLYANKQLY